MRASAEIVIERPMDAVWRWASDPDQWHRWEEDLGEVRPEDYEIAESTPPRRQVVRTVRPVHSASGGAASASTGARSVVRNELEARRRLAPDLLDVGADGV